MASSSVFYRFKSRKDESRVSFDGTGISVFDLKREIILANNMGKANDFDLEIYDSTMQEYTDDATIIPRSSSIIVKRVPAARPGKGKASMYIGAAGNTASVSEARPGAPITASTWHKGALSVRFDGKDDGKKAAALAAPTATSQDSEAAAMAAMFQEQSVNWEETQEKMSHAQRIFTNPRGGAPRGGKPHNASSPYPQPQLSDRPLPPSYVCYRCGQKGHWINMCPTNSDREYDNRPRIKRTTGIPRSMLKSVEGPSVSGLGEGVMVTPEGGYVVAQPDLASWQKQVAKPKGITAAEVRERVPSDPTLIDPLDKKLFRDPVRTPCCQTAHSEENIQTYLLENDFICPNCGKNIQSLDKLVVDKPLRVKINDYIEKAIEESKAADAAGDAPAVPEQPPQEEEEPGEEGQIQGEEAAYSVYDPSAEIAKMQSMVDNIPQLQAQINQLDVMRLNTSLPKAVRETTEMQYQDLQMQMQQAQNVAVTLAMMQQQQAQMAQLVAQQGVVGGVGAGPMMGVGGGSWPGLGGGNEGPYQRLPVNNRQRAVRKSNRPSDFLEVGGGGGQH